MANQYVDNFPYIAVKKFGKTTEELLRDFANDGLSYSAAAEKTGLKKGTIRKWCVHY